jgi:hypothetical protein
MKPFERRADAQASLAGEVVELAPDRGPDDRILERQIGNNFRVFGSARSRIMTESFPAGNRTRLPSSSQSSFSSLPTIINGIAEAS